MFNDGSAGSGLSTLGLAVDMSGTGFETDTPALPAPGQSGLPGDGSGNYQMAPPQQMQGPQVPPGAIVIPTDGGAGMAAPGYPGGQQMQGPWAPVEPTDTSQAAAVRSAGITALLAAGSFGAGIAAAGPLGGAAGILLASGLANGYRAQKWWGSPDPSEKHEAVVSSVFGLAAIGIGAYLAYRAYQEKKEGGGEDEEEEESSGGGSEWDPEAGR
jgi:hypothetical protein